MEDLEYYRTRCHELADQIMRWSQTSVRAAETIADLGERLQNATEALTIAAATLESALARIQRMEPVVEAAVEDFRKGPYSMRVYNAVEAYLAEEPS